MQSADNPSSLLRQDIVQGCRSHPTLNRQVAIAMEKGEQRITVDPIPYFGNDPTIVSLNGSFQFQWR